MIPTRKSPMRSSRSAISRAAGSPESFGSVSVLIWPSWPARSGIVQQGSGDMRDVFQFWGGLPGTTHQHPADKDILSRLKHQFDLNCLITPYRGPLRTAPVILLFLSPGLEESDKNQATENTTQDYYVRMRTGNGQLSSNDEHPSAWKWDEKIIKQFGCNHEAARSKI